MVLKKFIDAIRLAGSDLFFPNILTLGPWSGDILRKGKPKVMLIELNPYKVLIGPNT